jgi:hypothetical protein
MIYSYGPSFAKDSCVYAVIVSEIMRKIFCLFMLAALTLSTNVSAGLVIDQSQNAKDFPMATFEQSDLAQSFQQSSNNVAGAGIYISEDRGTTGNVSIALWDALPSESGNMLAFASGLATQGSWFDVVWDPVVVVPDTTLFLVFTADALDLAIDGHFSDSYAEGNIFANAGYQAFGNFDFTFRTYSQNSSLPVPAPTGIAVLGLGLLTISFMRKR